MSTAQLSHRHIFGLKSGVKDNVWYVDENLVLYPAGHNTIIYNAENKLQKFIYGTPGTDGITALTVSPSSRYVATAERSVQEQVGLGAGGANAAGRGIVNVYDLHTLKKRKVLSTPESSSREYVSMSFSSNKLLLTQGGAPDWTLVVWQWEKAKPLASVKVSNAAGAAITECSFNPADPTLCIVSGNGIFKAFRLVDNQLKPMPNLLANIEVQNFLCHTWLPDDRVILGTDTGNLLLYEAGEFLCTLPGSPADGVSIACIISYTKGFICGGDCGTLRVFELSENVSEYYRETKVFKVNGHANDRICSITITPSEDYVAVSLSSNQIYVLGLSNTDILKPEEISFELLSAAFHAPSQIAVSSSASGGTITEYGKSTITGMDVCVRKPLVVTCGLDRSVRVWNYIEKNTELSKTFAEEAFSVAFHPSGLHILVGFSDKLRMMNLLMDDIRPFKEIPVKACRECQFSNGGQYFAAVNGNAIQVFNTYTCDSIATMRGHNGKVRSLYWARDDSGIISAGMDGAVYQWDLKENKREGEFVQKGVNYSSALCNRDGTHVFAVGSDRMLKEIEFPSSVLSKELDCDDVLGQVVLSNSQRMLFAGVAEPDRPGSVRAYKFPLTGDHVTYQCLSQPVTRMRISFDDNYLFVAGEDGCLCILDVREKEGHLSAKRDKELAVPFAEEILVTKSDLEEKNTLMQELKNKVDELTLHNEYQLRLKDMNYNEKIKEVTEKFTQELEQDKNKYELLREEKNDMEMEYEEKIKQMEEKHQHELQEIESTYQSKIMGEVERYQQLVHERDLQQGQWEEQQQILVESHEQYVAEVTEDYEQKVEEDRQLKLQMQEEKHELIHEFEETKVQLEGDIDQEIEELKDKYEAKLNAEREATLRYKGENGIMKKKFSALQKDIEVQREEIKTMLEKEQELVVQIRALEREIQAHKREIRERDETIGDKEKRIYDLKKKNQELEKFKFVLDYKIKELKRQIEPRENEITDMKEQIKEMDQELEQYHKSNAALDLMIGELRDKLDGMQQEIMRQRQRLSDQHSTIRRFRSELHDCVQNIQDPRALRESVSRLYKCHVQEQIQTEELDSDIQREYHRQREYLEKSVEALKKRLARDMALHKQDNMRIMQENMSLIKEINELRSEMRLLKQVQRDNEGGNAMGGPTPPGGRRRSGRPGGRRKGGKRESQSNQAPSEEDLRTIEDQRAEIGRLKEYLQMLQEKMVANRPVSRERLPPMEGFATTQ